jgi:DNA replication protein DnaC
MPAAAVCPECNGTGWKIVEREEVSGAVRCKCVAADRAERLESGAGIPPLYANASFDNFVLPRDHPIEYPAMTKVFLDVRGYARTFPAAKEPGLLLMGNTGTGKTHLAVAAFRALMAKGHKGLYFDYQHLLDSIREGYDPLSDASDREAYRVAMESEVLLIDDLGNNRVKDWIEDTVTSILTYRCNNHKATIVTTNLVDGDAGYVTYKKKIDGTVDYQTTLTERIGPRARSRLFEMCRVIKMPVVQDYRVRKQGETR